MKPLHKQRGFSLVYFLILLGIASGAGLMYLKPNAETLKFNNQQKQLDLLERAKNNLLVYTSSIPEIYATNDDNNTPVYLAGNRVSGPGYLPLPVTHPFGTVNQTCANSDEVVIGYLPQTIGNRHFTFSTGSTPIHYAVDCRYVIQNTNFNNGTIGRFSPLNPNNPTGPNAHISVDTQTNLVAFIFIDPEQTAADIRTAPTSSMFNRPNSRLIKTITHAQWVNTVCRRVETQRPRLDTIAPSTAHWFNNFDSSDNPVGANWRNITCP